MWALFGVIKNKMDPKKASKGTNLLHGRFVLFFTTEPYGCPTPIGPMSMPSM
jgi:hypothetical protein